MEKHSPVTAVHDNFISDLAKTLSESLHIMDDQKSENDNEGNSVHDAAEKNLHRSLKQQGTEPNIKCLEKSATFPIPDTMLPSSSSDEEADSSLTESPSAQAANQTYSRSISLPAPLKLIPAIKGSREKYGGSQMKLTVKWAPDVYDPVPTLLSHTVKNKKQKYRKKKNEKKGEKKNGKKGQKGNSSRGGSGKDKKQFHKLGGTTDLCYKSLGSRDNVIGAGASTELDALDVRCQDSYCGTSFLKTSVTELHFSLAEAQ